MILELILSLLLFGVYQKHCTPYQETIVCSDGKATNCTPKRNPRPIHKEEEALRHKSALHMWRQ
jgi:hypothetical protein